jgi:enterochelin esterase family protein
MTTLGVGAQQQPPPPAPTPAAAPGAGRGGGRGGAAIVSPEIAPDGRVTCRLRAPNAREVLVTGFGQRLAMTKNDQGVWTATTSDPLKPDIYTYSFNVDGTNFNDPQNPNFKTAFGNAGTSLLRVPGSAPWDPGRCRADRSRITSNWRDWRRA